MAAKAIKKLEISAIKSRMVRLKTERGNFEQQWQEVTDYFLPRKNTVQTKKTEGQKRTWQLLDNTGVHSNELLAGALHGMLTNPYQPWFEYTSGDLAIDNQDDVRLWLQKVARDTVNILNNSNFQTEVHELYMDLPSIATACMLIEEDEKDIVRFSTKFIADYYIDENHLGFIDQVYREWKWGAVQMVAEFGHKNLPKKVQDAYDKKLEDKFAVTHAVYPKYLVDKNAKETMGYVSQYVLVEENFEISCGEYKEFPYVVPRFSKAAGEKYGRGPAMTALPEIKVLNKMNETMLIGAQKIVDPPLQLPDDGFIMPIITRPGGLNYRRSGNPEDRIMPIFNDTRIDFGYQVMADMRKRIKDAFYVDQLKLSQESKYMTATEVTQRTEESMRLLGPMLGRMQSEFLKPLLDRVFRIMLDRGLIDKKAVPAVLQGKDLQVRYSSLIAKAQKINEAQAIFRTVEAATPFIQLDPGVKDLINGDAALRIIAGTFGLPQEILNSQKTVEALRAQRAEQQQMMMQQQLQAQELQNAGQVAQVAATASKVQGE